MTPISDVFMLSIESKLDYELLKNICRTGHSRVPVYEEVEVPAQMRPGTAGVVGVGKGKVRAERVLKVKKIVGILLVKQCVLLDPNGGFDCHVYIHSTNSYIGQTQSLSERSP